MSADVSGVVTPPNELIVRRFNQSDGEVAVLEFAANSVRLSRAEVAILTWILRGAANAEIAEGRGTAVRTVSNQVSAMLAKLGVGSRAELASRWLEIVSARWEQTSERSSPVASRTVTATGGCPRR